MIGQTINDRYEITARLGKGAMGTVYRATDTQSGRDVALKVISSELVGEPGMLERFKREGEALSKLKHANIVEFIDAFQHEEHYVIVMEYVSGGSLHEMIRAAPLSIEKAREIALDLCDALIRAHRLNIIHRVLKPENILIDQDGTPKLADFGVARLNEGTRMTRSGTQVGTPYYMAPEAWEGKPLDAQADIWSLGVILFEMLTGQVPFGGETGAAVMNKVLTSQPPDLKKLRAEVPPSLAKIIRQMLTRDKNQRYPTMRQLAADLERGQLVRVGTLAGVKSSSGLPVLSGLGLILAIAAVWLLTRDQGAQFTPQVVGLTNTPLSTSTRAPGTTPSLINTSPPIPNPLIANLGSVVFNESFDDLDFPFNLPGSGRIETSALVLEGTGNGLYASFLVEPDFTTIILFKTTNGTQFNIGYHTGGYGTETLRRFSYESSGSRWELYEGNVDASGGNIPIRRWQASPLQFDTWHYILLTRSANGDIDAKIFERDNPQNMIELHEHLGSEWSQLPLSSFIDFQLGSVVVDEYQDIQPSGELASQTGSTPADELLVSETPNNQNSATPTSTLQRASPATSTTDSTYVADLTTVSSQVGFSSLGIGKYPFTEGPFFEGVTIKANGISYSHALFAHAPSELIYSLNGAYSSFVSSIFIDGYDTCSGTAQFIILLDGEVVYRSDALTYQHPVVEIINVENDVSGGSQLTLITNSLGDNYCDMTVWGDPYLVP